MLNTLRPVEVVCFWDPAIDIDRSDYPGYIDSRDIDKLVFRSGVQPTLFRCRPLSNEASRRALIVSDGHSGMQRLVAFQHSVYRVTNATLMDGREGADISPTALTNKPHSVDANGAPDSSLTQLWSEAELGRTFDLTTIMEVGEVVRQRSFLPPGIAADFELPPTSARLLAGLRGLYAAAMAPSPGTTTEPPAPPTHEGGDSDDAPGDATATG